MNIEKQQYEMNIDEEIKRQEVISKFTQDDSVESLNTKTPRIENSEIDETPRGKSRRQAKNNKSNRMLKSKKIKINEQSDEYCIDECLFNRKDSGQKMIFCDGKCEIWFHLKCLKITDEESERLGKWYCKNCSVGK